MKEEFSSVTSVTVYLNLTFDFKVKLANLRPRCHLHTKWNHCVKLTRAILKMENMLALHFKYT